MKKTLLTLSLLLIALTLSGENANAQLQNEAPRVGVFTIESVPIQEGTTIELACISESSEFTSYPEKLNPDNEGKIIPPLEIDRNLCPHDCFSLELQSEEETLYTPPFICLLSGAEKSVGNEKPILRNIERTTEDDKTFITIDADNTAQIYISGDIKSGNEWKDYTDEPQEIQLLSNEEIQTVFVTLGNGPLMDTIRLEFNASSFNIFVNELEKYLPREDAETYAKLITGGEVTAEQAATITDPRRIQTMLDTDQDGLSNVQEKNLGTDSNKRDTDGDSIDDGTEVLKLGTDPLNPNNEEDIQFTNLKEGGVVSGPAIITGRGIPETPINIRVIAEKTDKTLAELTTITDKNGAFSITLPTDITNQQYRLEASQQGIASRVIRYETSTEQSDVRIIVDSVNEYEIPYQQKKLDTQEISIKNGQAITIYGSTDAQIIDEDINIIAIDENTGETRSVLINKGGSGLFGITFPDIEPGEKSYVIQASKGNEKGELIRIPLNILLSENQTISLTSKEGSIQLVIYMLIVGTLTIYVFFLRKKKTTTKPLETTENEGEEENNKIQ